MYDRGGGEILRKKINLFFMDSKSIVWIFMFVGSTIGSFLPTLWGAGLFSMSSVFLTGVGGITGIWLGFRLSN